MGRVVIRESEAEVFDRGGGVRSIPLMSGAKGAQNVSTGMTIMAPGAGLPLHFHDTEECITCVEGVATAEIDGEEQLTFCSRSITCGFRKGRITGSGMTARRRCGSCGRMGSRR